MVPVLSAVTANDGTVARCSPPAEAKNVIARKHLIAVDQHVELTQTRGGPDGLGEMKIHDISTASGEAGNAIRDE